MAANNLWDKFSALLPSDPIGYGTVLSHETGNISRVQIPSGEVVRLQGQSVAIGNACWYRQGQVSGEAPTMTVFNETV